MKIVLYLAVFALFFTACFSSGINTPGIRASGLSPSPPSPAYGHLANESKALDYKHVEVMEAMDYEFKVSKAWEACIKNHGPNICREIHGNKWPYFMNNYFMPTHGYPMQGMGGFMGMQTQNTMNQVMTAHQIGTYINAYNAYIAYATAVAQAWSTPVSDPKQEENKAELKAMRDELLALIEKVRPAIQQAAEQAGE